MSTCHVLVPLPRSHAQTTDSLYLLALQRVGNKFSQADLALQYHELVGKVRDCVSVPFFLGASCDLPIQAAFLLWSLREVFG